MHPIVALWAHPRSLSTAIERIFIERGDFVVMHEPFSELYYMLEGRANAVHADFDATNLASYETIRSRITEAARQKSVCFKDMCYHCHDHLKKDDSFLRRITNVFLIRDPRQAIASHFAKNPDVTCEEIGYEAQASIFRQVWDLTDKQPLVIDADDLQQDPAGIMETLFRRIGFEHLANAMHWQPGHHEQWDTWKQWHQEVAESDAIHANRTAYAKTVDNEPLLAKYYAHHLPFYQKMLSARISAP
jgi:hypothetical protein